MTAIPCPVCGGPLMKHCSSPTCPSWDTCSKCGANVHRYLLFENGIRQHSHDKILPAGCPLCGPTWDPRLEQAKP